MAAGAVISAGDMVGFTAGGGFARRLVALDAFAGVAMVSRDNTGGLDGAKKIRVKQIGWHKLNGSGLTQASVGDLMYASDHVTITATSAGNSKIGRGDQFISTTKMLIMLDVPQA
jgi:hypothetical protein